MNYQRVYNQLIAKAQARSNFGCYVEKHHIVPKSLGGTDAANNLVKLTAREHFVAHYLLAKMHGGTQWAAIARMRRKNIANSKLYSIARIQHGKNMQQRLKGYVHTAQARENMKGPKSEIAKMHMRKPKTAKHALNISKGLKGKPVTWGYKISLALQGKEHAIATKEKMRASQLERWRKIKQQKAQTK